MFCRRFLVAALTLTAFMSSSFAAVSQNLNVNGANRNMLVYAPANLEKNRPLIIQMHGMNQDAPYQQDKAKWEPIADTARFVVVFPNGEGKAWDISGDKDVNFLKAIINEMSSKYGIDKKRVYVSGFSMGGMMSYHAANKMGDMIAAIAPVSGYPIGNPAPASKRTMPIIHTHGTSDDVVNYNSGVNYLKRWVDYEKCSANSEKISQYPVGRTSSAASLEKWTGCKDNSEIRLMTIAGKGHWYSMDLASVNTSDEIWNFVKRFSLDGAAAETPVAPPFVEPTNRDSVYNGGFDSTANAWTLQTHGDAKATGTVKDGKYSFEISAVGAKPYTVQLIQHNIRLEKDQWYEVGFEAAGASARTLEVNVEQHEDPWDSYLDETKNFELGSTAKTFSFKFQMKAATDTNARLSFNAGAAAVNMSLDNVSIKKIDAPSSTPEEDLGNEESKCDFEKEKCEVVADSVTGILDELKFAKGERRLYKIYNMNGNFVGLVRAANFEELKSGVRNVVRTSGVYLINKKKVFVTK